MLDELLKKLENKNLAPIEPGLGRTLQALKRFGNPHLKLPPTVHVAGTNGKGSCIAFLKAILEAAGYNCHVYTSPHLVRFNERIVLAGHEITDEYLTQLTLEYFQICEGLELTFFEATTAVAFKAFADTKADFLLLETGLGGRLDATNVIPQPLLSIITSISLDHTEYLGNTLAAITYEKAGIIKPETPIIAAPQMTEEINQIISQHAASKGSTALLHGWDWDFEITKSGFNLSADGWETIPLPHPSLAGAHQYDNAATAALAAMLIDKKYPVKPQAIQHGIVNAKWPGRLQKLKSSVLPNLNNSDIWLDGAHNPDAASKLADFLRDTCKGRDIYMLSGMLKTKDAAAFYSCFKGMLKKIYLIDLPHPLGMPAGDLSDICQSLNLDAVAIKNMQEISIPSTAVNLCLIITGSLYLAGMILSVKQSNT